MSKGKLYLVGLPIGNWDDVSKRALDYIKNAKYLIIEREEAFEQIWNKLGMQKPNAQLIPIEMDSNGGEPGHSYELQNMQQILDILESGEDMYLVSDEGMPGIADPGELITKQAIARGIEIIATPGPSVAIASVAVAGCMHNFSFESFLPWLSEERIDYITKRKYNYAPMVFVLRNMMRTPDNQPAFHTEIPEFLNECIEVFGPDRKVVMCYNLTLPNEKTIRGTLKYMQETFLDTRQLGDLITIVIDTDGNSFGHMGQFKSNN